MNNKRLISLTVCLILATVPGISSLILADIALETDTKAEQYFEKANELRKLADYDAAIAEYKKVISLSPNSKIAQDAQYWIGQSYFRAGQFDAALSAFQELLDEYPASTIVASTKQMMERVQQAKKIKSLFEAVRKGDIEQVKLLISKGADVNAIDEFFDTTTLYYAAKTGKMEVVQLLVEAGADVNAGTTWPPLCVAVDEDNIVMAEYLIAHGADVNAGGDWTALQEAPYFSSIEMVELLIAKGANVNAGPYTALHGAVQNNRLDIIELLLQKGADINAIGNIGKRMTPLCLGTRYYDFDTIKLLIDKGADINIKDEAGLTPLYWAAHRSSKDILDLILNRGNYANTIHLAACKGDLSSVTALIEQGTDVNTKDEFGCTPLHWAIAADSPELVDFLIDKGADLNAKDGLGFTPLMSARDVPMLERLISKGADIHAKSSKSGETKLHMACRDGNKDLAELLIRRGADINVRSKRGTAPLGYAAVTGHGEIVELLIEKGVDINVPVQRGRTALALAQKRGLTEVVSILRQHGALETLHGSAASGDIDGVKRLIAQGANLNSKNHNGWTPLHFAVFNWGGGVVRFLISQGADINAKTKSGKTPLMMAVGQRQKILAELLINNGADITAKDNKGKTPLQLAKEKGDTSIVELLRKHGAKE